RAAEWTRALTSWCDAQPGLLAFTGQCAVHRGQIMRVHGAYVEALEEFERAAQRYVAFETPHAAGLAMSERGDVFRIQGTGRPRRRRTRRRRAMATSRSRGSPSSGWPRAARPPRSARSGG